MAVRISVSAARVSLRHIPATTSRSSTSVTQCPLRTVCRHKAIRRLAVCLQQRMIAMSMFISLITIRRERSVLSEMHQTRHQLITPHRNSTKGIPIRHHTPFLRLMAIRRSTRSAVLSQTATARFTLKMTLPILWRSAEALKRLRSQSNRIRHSIAPVKPLTKPGWL